MQIQVFTHNSDRVKTRRFFVNKTNAHLYRELENEIHRVFHKNFVCQSNNSLYNLHTYVKWRIGSLDLSKYTELIDISTMEKHLLDYCDVIFFRLFPGDKTRLVFRMFKYSEPLLIDKLDAEKNAVLYQCIAGCGKTFPLEKATEDRCPYCLSSRIAPYRE